MVPTTNIINIISIQKCVYTKEGIFNKVAYKYYFAKYFSSMSLLFSKSLFYESPHRKTLDDAHLSEFLAKMAYLSLQCRITSPDVNTTNIMEINTVSFFSGGEVKYDRHKK